MDGNLPIGLYRPAGAHRIATAIRNIGYDIEVVDYFNYWHLDELKKLIQSRCDQQTLFIGWSLTFYFAADPTLITDLINWIRLEYPKIKLIAGGTSTLFSQVTGLDYYVDGFAENAMRDLLDHMKGQAKNIPFEKLEDGGLYINALTHYPTKNFGDLKIIYQNRDFVRPEEVLTFEVSRGCVFQCKFCNFPITGKKSNDHIRIFENLREELVHNYECHGTISYIFSEETVNDSKYKIEVLSEVVKSLPFKPKFRGFFRVDLMHKHESTIQIFKDMNVVGMHLGIETFYHPAGLAIGKGLHPDKVKLTLKKIRQIFGDNLSLNASFIIGLPGEPVTSILATQNWLESSENPINAWTWFPLRLTDPTEKRKASYFSKNSEKYGYKILGKAEAGLQAVMWENPIMTFYEAEKLAKTLTDRSLYKIGLNTWQMAACESLSTDPSSYMGRAVKGENSINVRVLIKSAKFLVKNYIAQKLNLYTKEHSPQEFRELIDAGTSVPSHEGQIS